MTPDSPAVTVVIPLYNGVEHLEQAISGVLAQTCSSLELIVVDDGSTDGSVDLARAVMKDDDRCRVLTFPNAGVAVARNRGLHEARGGSIAFLDQDDRWYPTKLARQVQLLDERPEVAVVGCLMDYIGRQGQRLGRTAQTPTVVDREAVRRAVLVPFPISAALFRTDILRAHGGSRDLFGRGLATAADLELMAAAAAEGDVACVREPLGGYRIHRGSVTARSHQTQITAVLYLQRVMDDPAFPSRSSWEMFERTHRPSLRIRRMTRVIYHYRQAGLEALDRRWAPAAVHFAGAAIMSPPYTARRLFLQLRGR